MRPQEAKHELDVRNRFKVRQSGLPYGGFEHEVGVLQSPLCGARLTNSSRESL